MRSSILLIAAVLLAGCGSAEKKGSAVTGGDSAHGAQAITKYGCGSCHTIRGISGANGRVGPPLVGFADRMYIAGVLPNNPDSLTRWIQDPKAVDEKTAMPKLGVTAQDATDIAAYLYANK